MADLENICLGTVKLGLPDYGFNSSSRKVDTSQFLKDVGNVGITKYDTAPSYGESESVLGKYIQESNKPVFVSSKIDSLNANDPNSSAWMVDSVKNSLSNLNIDSLDICYLHQNDLSILSDPFVLEGMQLLKEKKLIKYSGASVYSLAECELCIKLGIYNYIQVPVSIFDVSFYDEFIKNNKTPVKFTTRSILLQGLIVNRNKIKNRINVAEEVIEYLNKIDRLSREADMGTIDIALSYVFSLNNISQYIIGTTSIESINNVVECLGHNLSSDLVDEIYSIASFPKKWTNPRIWLS